MVFSLTYNTSCANDFLYVFLFILTTYLKEDHSKAMHFTVGDIDNFTKVTEQLCILTSEHRDSSHSISLSALGIVTLTVHNSFQLKNGHYIFIIVFG